MTFHPFWLNVSNVYSNDSNIQWIKKILFSKSRKHFKSLFQSNPYFSSLTSTTAAGDRHYNIWKKQCNDWNNWNNYPSKNQKQNSKYHEDNISCLLDHLCQFWIWYHYKLLERIIFCLKHTLDKTIKLVLTKNCYRSPDKVDKGPKAKQSCTVKSWWK